MEREPIVLEEEERESRRAEKSSRGGQTFEAMEEIPLSVEPSGYVHPRIGPRISAETTPFYVGHAQPMGPAPPPALLQRRAHELYLQQQERDYRTGGKRVKLAGDKKQLIVGYKQNSLCSTLVNDAVERALMATEILDSKHADIIRARLQKAQMKNGNASHAGSAQISFKKAASIALQAERWVYQAQAAAAKSAAKQSKHCLHNLAGRRKRTKEEKEETYRNRYGMERGERVQRAVRKHQKAIAQIQSMTP